MQTAEDVRSVERGVAALERIGDALSRIADAVQGMGLVVEPVAACGHPTEAREIAPGSTMTSTRYRCRDCGEEMA